MFQSTFSKTINSLVQNSAGRGIILPTCCCWASPLVCLHADHANPYQKEVSFNQILPKYRGNCFKSKCFYVFILNYTNKTEIQSTNSISETIYPSATIQHHTNVTSTTITAVLMSPVMAFIVICLMFMMYVCNNKKAFQRVFGSRFKTPATWSATLSSLDQGVFFVLVQPVSCTAEHVNLDIIPVL